MSNTSFFTETESEKEDSSSNKRKMKTNLENIKRVRFNDFSDYDSEKCNNGGKYGFWTDYNCLENGNWEVLYGTTADLDFCPCCGDFHSYDEESCGECTQIAETELLKLINNFEETEDRYVEYQ